MYRGRTIAILNHYGRLYVYLDHILQHNVVFTSRTDALGWLMQRIDQPRLAPRKHLRCGFPSARPAEAGVSP
jgi:hypothetical protein